MQGRHRQASPIFHHLLKSVTSSLRQSITGSSSMKTIALHGMLHSHNFGDVLLAAANYQWLKSHPYEEISPIFPWVTDRSVETDLSSLGCRPENNNLRYDKTLFFGGGYPNDSGTNRGAISRAKNIHRRALTTRLRGKQYGIFGVGAGPINSFSGKIINNVFFNNSEKLAVRDLESKYELLSCGIPSKKITLVADAAILYIHENYPLFPETKKEKRTLLLHITESTKESIEAIKHYIRSADHYDDILVVPDKVTSNTCALFLEEIKLLSGRKLIIKEYESADKLIKLINSADDIITTKYHVGIVAATLKKRVVALPWNYLKTSRFYNQINSSQNCIPLHGSTQEKITQTIINSLQESPALSIPNRILEDSKKTRELIYDWSAI